MNKKLVYVAGAYRASTISGVFENIMTARQAAIDLWNKGYVPICPHLNSFLMDEEDTDEMFLSGDLEILKRCDCIFMLANWQNSHGARAELRFAREHGLEVMFE